MKIRYFKEWLIIQHKFFIREFNYSKKIDTKIKCDVYAQILDKLERFGWIDTFMWLQTKLKANKEYMLTDVMVSEYKKCFDKMESL